MKLYYINVYIFNIKNMIFSRAIPIWLIILLFFFYKIKLLFSCFYCSKQSFCSFCGSLFTVLQKFLVYNSYHRCTAFLDLKVESSTAVIIVIQYSLFILQQVKETIPPHRLCTTSCNVNHNISRVYRLRLK